MRDLDLNLLVALRALLAERHVTRAAARVGISQPAMSHALGRLRELLGDPVLVRTPRGMMPTARAEAMREPLERALDALSNVVDRSREFVPATAKRKFRIATDDYVGVVLVPKLLARLREEAPRASLELTPTQYTAGEDLANGRVDAVLGISAVLGALSGVLAQKLFSERFVCCVREDHPSVGKRMSLETFVALPHALVSPAGRRGSVVDTALAKQGLSRHVAVVVPHFLLAPVLVRESDLVLTIGERVARAAGPGLRVLKHPLELPGYTVSLLWHERSHGDPGHAWFRRVVHEVSRAI